MPFNYVKFLKDAGWKFDEEMGWYQQKGVYFSEAGAVGVQGHQDAEERQQIEKLIANRKFIKDHTGK